MSMAMPDAVILVNIIYVGLKTPVYTVPRTNFGPILG